MTLTWYRHFKINGGLKQILERQTYFIGITFQFAKLAFVNLDTHEVFNDLK
jgi:hypothetical protein